MNRKTLSEAMVVISEQVNGRVNEFLEGEYVSVALDSWTDVTKVTFAMLCSPLLASVARCLLTFVPTEAACERSAHPAARCT